MVPFEALYGRPCRSPVCWLKPEYQISTGPDDILDKNMKISIIQQRLRTTQIGQKSYANLQRRPLEFEEGDFVILRVSLCKGIIHFGIKVKLAPRCIGQFQIVQRVGVVANCLALP